MKRYVFWLLLHGICGSALVSSCKNDEIDPIDNLLGYYLGPADIKLEKRLDSNILIKATRVLYKRGISPNGGYEDYYKDYEIPNCKIILIDTVIVISNNNANQKQFYAKIINKDNNTVFGNITNWDSYSTGAKKEYYLLRTDFFPRIDSLNYSPGYFKWVN